jgi:hypothetical protein
MPSKPLFGSPVVVGMSAAVMAMRSIESAAAGAVAARKAERAMERRCGRVITRLVALTGLLPEQALSHPGSRLV